MAAGRLSGLDTAFLCLDREVSPMHLGGLAIFRPARPGDPERVADREGLPDVQRLAEAIQPAAAALDRRRA
ncbi:MAG: hypothetical protein ACRDSZ_13085 [Pseudonocardiaceae bacterium]